MINKIAYLGTAILLIAPYLVHLKIGFVLLIIGIGMVTPQVLKAKQYNLVLLNISSMIGYLLQVTDIL